MKKLFILACAFLVVQFTSAQLIATTEVKEPIDGLCDGKTLYAMLPGFGDQTAPVAPITNAEIEKRLNSEVQFLKDNPKFKGELMISCIISCNGIMLKCEIDNKSGNDELDNQVVAVFNTLLKWTPGKLSGIPVDCIDLISMEVKKGKITLN